MLSKHRVLVGLMMAKTACITRRLEYTHVSHRDVCGGSPKKHDDFVCLCYRSVLPLAHILSTPDRCKEESGRYSVRLQNWPGFCIAPKVVGVPPVLSTFRETHSAEKNARKWVLQLMLHFAKLPFRCGSRFLCICVTPKTGRRVMHTFACRHNGKTERQRDREVTE